MKKSKIPHQSKLGTGQVIILILVLLIFGIGLYFKDNVLIFYNNFGKNLQQFEKTDLGSIINEVKKEVLTPPPLNVGGEASDVVLIKAKIIAETNIQRYNNGLLSPLFENAKLNAAALAKANDMFLNQYFEHVSPTGVDPGTLVKSYSYDYIVTGENLILGNFESEKELVQLWMDSPGHRANILNGRFTEIGVAILKGVYNGKTVWIGVQEFGLPLSSCPEPSLDLKSQIDFNKNQLDQLSLQIDLKLSEIDNTKKRSSELNVLIDEYNQLVGQYNILNEQTKIIIVQYNSQVNIFNQCVSGQ